MNTCHVANAQCEAPAGWGTPAGYATNTDRRAKYRCIRCGEPVCGKCSTAAHKGRICDDCHED